MDFISSIDKKSPAWLRFALQRLILLILFHWSLVLYVHAQAISPKKALKEANTYFKLGEYRWACPIFKQLDSIQSSPRTAARLGICMLHTGDKLKALPYLQKAQAAGYKKDALSFYLAKSYHLNHQFEKAIEAYEASLPYYRSGKKKDSLQLAQLIRQLETCKNGLELAKSPLPVTIENLGDAINTRYAEYAPVISADENRLIFTSRRPTNVGKNKTPGGQYFEDMYVSERTSWDQAWPVPQNMGTRINTPGHDASINLSSSGNELLIYKDMNDGDIFISRLVSDAWELPRRLEGGVNSKSHEPSACLSPSDQLLIFASNRPGGYGGYDLYYCRKDAKGKWGPAKNLGATVNTRFDEDSPFIHPDGQTLYFSSRGHKSMGGFDIFTSQFEDSSMIFSAPENIGYPINSADDDVYFVFSADGQRAYFSSQREDSRGETDIYRMTFNASKKALILFNGRVFSNKTVPPSPIEAQVEVNDNEDGSAVKSISSNGASGKFTLLLPPGKNYGIHVRASGHLPYSENVFIEQRNSYYQYNKDVFLEPLEKDKVTTLKNIFFDSGKWELKQESQSELNLILNMLKADTALCAEIAGHTDDIGPDQNNQLLSENRAKAVCTYLIQGGIAPQRLISIGYGELFPLANNTQEEGRQLNRRTELILVDRQALKTNYQGYYFRRK